MNHSTERNVRSAVWTAILVALSILVLTCTMTLGIAAADGDTYTLKLNVTLYDENGDEWPVGLQTELAAGETIDTDNLYFQLVSHYPHLAGTSLSADGFVGLPADGKMPAQDLTLTATYEVRPYTVTWIVDGVATEQKVAYNKIPVFEGSTDKAPDAQYTYVFAGWDNEPVKAKGDATYTATYTEVLNKYTVTWIVDGETAKTEELEYGTIPSFTPAKDNTAQYTYTFAGWDKEITAVEGDVTYTGSFTATVNKYTVTWIVDGQTTTTEVEYGAVPTFDGTPSKAPDAQYTYTFAGWTPAVVAVTGDVTYTATFDNTPNTVSITFKVEGQADVTLVVQIGETPAYPNGTPSKAATAQYTYTFAGWDKAITAATEDTVYTATFTSTVNKYTVTWVVGDKTTTETYEYGKTPAFKGSTDKASDAQYTYTFTGWDKTVAAVSGDATYTAQYSTTVRKYYVYFYYGHNTVLPTIVEYGQAATAPANTDKAPTAEFTYTFDGWDVDFSNITGTLKVYAKYTETVRTYTVTFNYGDGKTETVTVEYGKGATAPTDTDKAATEEYTYTFKGWDADFSEITADLTVNAQYDETPVKEPETTDPDTEEPEDPTEETTEVPEDPTDPSDETTEEPTEQPEDPTEEPTETESETEAETEEPVPAGCGNAWIWIIVVIVVAGAAAAVVIILLRRKNGADPEPTEPEAEPEPEVEPAPAAPAAPLFIPVGEEVPEEEIPEAVETVEEVAATDVDEMMTDKAAAHFLVASDEEGGAGKMGIINVGVISAAYQAGETVDLASLQEKGMIDAGIGRLKVLASGTLDKPLIIKADAFSVQAVKMITLTGGQAIELKGE